MAVDVGVAVPGAAAVRLPQIIRKAQPGQLPVLAQLASAGVVQLPDAGQAQQLPVRLPGQHPGGDALPHRLPPYIQVVVPVQGSRPAAPVPGADGQLLLPPQGPLQAVPHPGEHPERPVLPGDDLPGEAAMLRGLGGRLLEVSQQGRGLADPLSVHIPGVDGQGHLIPQAHVSALPRISRLVLQHRSSMSSAVAAGMRISAPHWPHTRSTEL